MKTFSSTKFSLVCLLLFSISFGIPNIKSQTQTCNADIHTNKAGYPQGQNVKVYIDPTITGARRDAVWQAFANW